MFETISKNPFAGITIRWFDIYVVELTKLIVRIRGNLGKLERKVIVALVTTDVHARDIIDELYENKARQWLVDVDLSKGDQ